MPLSRRARRRLILVSVLVVLLAAGAVGTRYALRWRQAQALERARVDGLAASRAGEHERAITLLASVFRAQREDHEVIFALATSRLASPLEDDTHLGSAAALFARAAELRSDDVESRRQLVEIYPKLGFLREAMDAADEVLAVDPDDSKSRETRIQILASLGRWSEAVDECESMIAKRPDAPTWRRLQLSMALASGATPGEVLALTEQWPEDPTGDGLNDLLKATLLQLAGRADEAEPLVTAAIQKGAADPERLEAMSSILTDLGRTEETWALIDASMADGSPRDPRIASLAADLAFRAGDAKRLAEIHDSLPTDSPLRGELAARIVLISLDDGEELERQKWMDQLQQLARDPDSMPGVVLSAAKLARRFDREEQGRIAAAARSDGASVEVLLAAAHAASRVGDPVSALEHVGRAQAIESTLLGVVMQASLMQRTGQVEQSIDLALQGVRRYGGRPALVSLICNAWIDAPMLSAAVVEQIQSGLGFQTPLQCAEAIVESVGLTPLSGVLLVSAAIEADRLEVAEDVVVSAVSMRPPNVQYLMVLGDRLGAIAPELTSRLQQTLAELAPDEPSVIARTLGSQAIDLPAIRAVLPLDAESDPVRREAWMTLLSAFPSLDAEQFAEAANEAIERYPDDPLMLNVLLGDARSWTRQELVSDVISRLESLMERDSVVILVARANLLLAFQPEDVEGRNRLVIELSDVASRRPDSLMASVTLLRLLISDPNSDPQVAIRLGRQIVARHPSAIELYPILIDLMQQQGMLDEADAMLTQFEQVDVSGVASARQRARQSLREGDLDRMVLTLTELARQSGGAGDLLQLGLAKESVGDFRGAETIYRQALVDPDAPTEVIYRLASILARQGRSADAEVVIAEHGDELSDGRRELVLGVLLLQARDVEGAIARFRKAVQVVPKEGDAWRLLATSLALVGQDKDAMQAAIEGLKHLPDSEELMGLLLGSALRDGTVLRLLVESPSINDLPAVLQECLRLLQRSIDPQTNLLQPDPEELRLARELCGRSGDTLITWRTAMSLHAVAGQVAEARALAAAASRAFPSESEPWEWQVRMASALGEVDEAIRLCRDWRRAAFPDVESVDHSQAVLELGRKRADLALELLRPHQERIAAMQSDDPGPYRSLLGALIMTGNVREAMRLEGARLAESPTARDVWARLASLAPYDSGLEAMSFLEAATPSTAPERAAMIGTWIQFHRRHPDGEGLARARALLPRDGVQATDASSGLLLVAKADVVRAEGDPGGMRRVLQSVIDSIPADAWKQAASIATLPLPEQQSLFEQIAPGIYARNNLAMVLVEQRQDLDVALRLVEECIAVLPNEPNLLDSRAQVLLALGRLSEAETDMVKVLRMVPLDPNFQLTAAEILAGSGRIQDAVQVVNRVQDLVAQEPWPSRELEERLRRVRALVQG